MQTFDLTSLLAQHSKNAGSLSVNGVWLTDTVPAVFLARM